MKRVMALVGLFVGLSTMASVAQAWPRAGMARLAGAWVGCSEDYSETFHISRDGHLWVTDSDDQDVLKTYCDSFKRTNGVKYIPEDLVLFCPEDDGGNPDPTAIMFLAFHFLDRDHISFRPYLDYETYVLRRVGAKPSAACLNATGSPVKKLTELLRGGKAKR